MGRLDALYARLPVWAQHGAVSAYGVYWKRLRFGPGYARYVAQYEERETWPREKRLLWIEERLRRVLHAAAVKTPYYRQTWSGAQKVSAAAGRLADLPLLEKDALRADPTAFVREDVHPLHTPVFHTSGSTGTPIKTIWTVAEYRDALALREARSARWAGVSFALPRATFSGRMVEPNPRGSGPFYRFNMAERQVYFSAFHLRRETAADYVAALARHRIEWLTGYAVSYYLLARFVLEEKLTVPPLKAVIPTSEKLTQAMREVIERAFGCRAFEEYSTVENAVFASECHARRLHVSDDASIVEILRPDGTPCEPEEEGEVVATCLSRSYQPLVRFRLGDVAAWSAEPCPCGRTLPVIKEVVGRIEDVVVGPDGRQMVRFHGIFTDQPRVGEGQIVQEALDRIRVRIVPSGEWLESDSQDIIRRVRQRLGPDVTVHVECVESIPRTKAGKFQAVVSLLNRHTARHE